MLLTKSLIAKLIVAACGTSQERALQYYERTLEPIENRPPARTKLRVYWFLAPIKWIVFSFFYKKDGVGCQKGDLLFYTGKDNWDLSYLANYTHHYALSDAPRVKFAIRKSIFYARDLPYLFALGFVCIFANNTLLFWSFVRALGFSRWANTQGVKRVFFRNPYHSYETAMTLCLNQVGIQTYSYYWVLPISKEYGLVINHIDFPLEYNFELAERYKGIAISTDSMGHIPSPHMDNIKILTDKPVYSAVGLFPSKSDILAISRSEDFMIKAFVGCASSFPDIEFKIFPHYIDATTSSGKTFWESLVAGRENVSLSVAKGSSYAKVNDVDVSFSGLSSIGIEFIAAGARDHYIVTDRENPLSAMDQTKLSNQTFVAKETIDDSIVLKEFREFFASTITKFYEENLANSHSHN